MGGHCTIRIVLKSAHFVNIISSIEHFCTAGRQQPSALGPEMNTAGTWPQLRSWSQQLWPHRWSTMAGKLLSVELLIRRQGERKVRRQASVCLADRGCDGSGKGDDWHDRDAGACRCCLWPEPSRQLSDMRSPSSPQRQQQQQQNCFPAADGGDVAVRQRVPSCVWSCIVCSGTRSWLGSQWGVVLVPTRFSPVPKDIAVDWIFAPVRTPANSWHELIQDMKRKDLVDQFTTTTTITNSFHNKTWHGGFINGQLA